MKILFLTPPLKAWDSHGNHKAANQMHAQLAAYLREKKLAEVDALDCRALEMNWQDMLQYVAKTKPDAVFVGELLHSTCGAAVIWYFNEGLRLIKEKFPAIRTIAGGLWYSGDFERQMRLNPWMDYIMIGEAELTLEELLNNYVSKTKDERDIAGLVSRRPDGSIVVGRTGG